MGYDGRFRYDDTGVGRSNSWEMKCGLVEDTSCVWAAGSQSMNHIVSQYSGRAIQGLRNYTEAADHRFGY